MYESILFNYCICCNYNEYKVIQRCSSLLHTVNVGNECSFRNYNSWSACVYSTAVRTGSKILGVVAIIFAMVNVAGGFCVTHRMLKMFKNQPEEE